MRVLGIDPGLTRCGLGAVEVDDSRRATLVGVEVARTSPSLATHFRLRDIADAIAAAIGKYQPEVVAIERVFTQDNLQSVTPTTQVMGAAMVEVGRAGLAMAVYTPSEVKSGSHRIGQSREGSGPAHGRTHPVTVRAPTARRCSGCSSYRHLSCMAGDRPLG